MNMNFILSEIEYEFNLSVNEYEIIYYVSSYLPWTHGCI